MFTFLTGEDMQTSLKKKATKPINTDEHIKLIQSGSDEVIKLVKKGEIPLEKTFNVPPYKNCTIWHLLANPKTPAAYKLLDKILKNYLENSADINAVDASGFTPIHWAAFAKRLDIIELFMSYGGNPQLVSKKNATALILVESSKDVILIEKLKALLNQYHLEKHETLEDSFSADKARNRYLPKNTNKVDAQNAMLDKDEPIPHAGSKEAFGQSVKSTFNNFISSFGCFFTHKFNSNKINDESEQKVGLVTNPIPQHNN